jgi:hypothetical protein
MVLKPLTALVLGIAAAFSITSADAQWRPYAGMGWYGGPYAGVGWYGDAYAGAYDSADVGYGYDGAYAYAGGYGFPRRTAPGAYYSYGADRANPSTDPSGFDQSNARDFQLNGHN